MDKNKLFAGLLAAGVVTLGALVIAEGIFKPDRLEKSVYEPEGVVASGDSADKAAAGPGYATGEAFATLVGAADPAAGEKQIKKCVACHAFEKGGANKVGPALWGVFGQPIGQHAAGYGYSDALKGKGGAWDIEALNVWLHQPRTFAPGNKMGFAGIKDDKQRAELVSYIKSLQ